jgi:hypothetical protein
MGGVMSKEEAGKDVLVQQSCEMAKVLPISPGGAPLFATPWLKKSAAPDRDRGPPDQAPGADSRPRLRPAG